MRAGLSLTQVAMVLLTLVALALGGTTELWAQATVAALAALLILIAPPTTSLPGLPVILFILLFILALAAFLPAVTLPPWRQHLVEDLHVPLPGTRTPQPWMTIQACGLFFIGLVWASYLLSQNWTGEQRFQAAQLLVSGIAILAAVTVVGYLCGLHLPGWNQMENRGWFPNRNQTSDVLALGGVLGYALLFDRLSKGRSSGWVWLIALTAIGAGLIVAYSRAGILLFFAGICLWQWGPGRRRKSAKWMTLSLAAIFILLTLFLLFGGTTLERFQSHEAAVASNGTDFRLLVQEDAFHFSLQEPALGIGLGNFESLFSAVRRASVSQERAVHPESDWLWLTCELGWLAPTLFLLVLAWWLMSCGTFQSRPGESLRRAMVIAVGMFFLHGFVDVSGHRVGSMFNALLLASLALPSVPGTPASRWAPPVFRGLAVLVLLLAGWWIASINGAPAPPTTATLAKLETLTQTAGDNLQMASMEESATEALRIAPLRWPFYYQRGYAEVFQRGKLSQAVTDFQTARFLEPRWVTLCYDEGCVWLTANQPDQCLDAWQDALQRSGDDAPGYFRNMFNLGQSNSIVRAGLEEWAGGNIDYLIIFLNNATPVEAKRMLSHWLSIDPELKSMTVEQRANLFDAWWTRGDQAELVAGLLSHPDWLAAGWPHLAQSYAQQKDFQRSWQLIADHASAPEIPTIVSNQPLPDLKRDFFSQPDNLAAGLMLVMAQIKEGQTDNALATLHALEKIPTRPQYVYYLEAQQWAQKQQWELAWNAWRTYARL
jgi:hypothetical protein